MRFKSHFLHSKVAENAAFFVAVRPDVRPNAKKEGSPDGERAQHLGGRTRRKKPWEKPPGAYFVSASIVALS